MFVVYSRTQEVLARHSPHRVAMILAWAILVVVVALFAAALLTTPGGDVTSFA